MEYTKEEDWEDQIGRFFIHDENIEAKVNLLNYVPNDVAVMIMKKLPPSDLIALCKVKNKRVSELCKDFMKRKDYQRIWGGEVAVKGDKQIWDGDLHILIQNITSQPKAIQRMMLMKVGPIDLVALCSINNKYITMICHDKEFIEKYTNIHHDSVVSGLNYDLKSNYDIDYVLNYLNLFSEYIPQSHLDDFLGDSNAYYIYHQPKYLERWIKSKYFDKSKIKDMMDDIVRDVNEGAVDLDDILHPFRILSKYASKETKETIRSGPEFQICKLLNYLN